ncbi:MAG: flagellar hook-length control protein FliK [Methylobacter sp.]|nr:flagellar hook-length control protein FliK [Methylobacter sp.]
MNTELANLSALAPSAGAVVGVSSVAPVSTEAGAIVDGFSSALVVQLELLTAVKTEDLSTLQTPVSLALPEDVSLPTAGLLTDTTDTPDFAALLGNNLPPSYKIQQDSENEAALAAVTDTLKYLTAGTTEGEKTAKAAQNMQEVIALAVPAQQFVKPAVAGAVGELAKPAAAVAVGEPVKSAVAVAVGEPVKPAVAVAVGESAKPAVAVAVDKNIQQPQVISPKQNGVNVTEQSIADTADQDIKNIVAMAMPTQMNLQPVNDKVGKKQNKDNAEIISVENNLDTAGLLLAANSLPIAMPVESAVSVNNLTPEEAVQGALLPPFTTPLTNDTKPNMTASVPNPALQGGAVLAQPDQAKQNLDLNYVAAAGQAEKSGSAEPLALNLETDKSLVRMAGADVAQLNRPVDNKADVPAITKPLSHPEWNKDLGERIVWMSSRAIPAAEIRLNPQHLGPVSVRVNVTDDQATVVFTAQNATTREALEASIPKLREMMSAQQLNLVDVTVAQGSTSDQGRSQAQQFAQTADRRGQGAFVDDGSVDDVEQDIANGRAVVSNGLLSLYA